MVAGLAMVAAAAAAVVATVEAVARAVDVEVEVEEVEAAGSGLELVGGGREAGGVDVCGSGAADVATAAAEGGGEGEGPVARFDDAGAVELVTVPASPSPPTGLSGAIPGQGPGCFFFFFFAWIKMRSLLWSQVSTWARKQKKGPGRETLEQHLPPENE